MTEHVSLGTELVLERKPEDNRTTVLTGPRATIALAPAVDEGYWSYRVKLNDRQAVLGFPKFGTIGIGFAVEDDGNTNLPYTCETIDIVSHIWHNVDSEKPAGDEFGEVEGDDITVAQVYAAVGAIQDAIAADHPERPAPRSHPSVMAVTVRGITTGG